MPPRKRPASSGRSKASDKRDSPADSTGRSKGRGRDGRAQRLRLNPDADPVRIHRQYVQERIGGGELPTPEAYERAVDQWHQPAGAVRAPDGEVPPPGQRGARRPGHGSQAIIETGAAAAW